MSDRAAQVLGIIIIVIAFLLGYLVISSAAAAVGVNLWPGKR